VLILRDVLGFSSRKTAKSLETTVASVNSALQRARNAVDERMPELSQQVTLRALDNERVRAVVEQYIAAWKRGDVEAIAEMLAEDATFAMPPYAMCAWPRRHRHLRCRPCPPLPARARERSSSERGLPVGSELGLLRG
jgi:RNA polymerase sigma-70 factor (ECF subfamily)